MKNKASLTVGLFMAAAITLPGCSLDPEKTVVTGSASRSYEITVKNLTNAQPLSPLAGVLHDEGYIAMTLGSAVSVALEKLAEGGDNSDFLSDAAANSAVSSTASTSGPIGPGKAGSILIEGTGRRLSLATMLVNTNDAMTGLNAYDLSALSKDETIMLSLRSYDTGTEANSEAVTDLPGPVAEGEGFNAIRDDRDFLTVHPGVITSDDGLASSVLTEAHRFDNPVARVMIKRIS